MIYCNGKTEIRGEAVVINGMRRAKFLLGGTEGGASLEGKVDEVAIYDRALSAKEVAAHYAESEMEQGGGR
jgi:hypothetical protein